MKGILRSRKNSTTVTRNSSQVDINEHVINTRSFIFSKLIKIRVF